jgi:hypothetical protein
MILEEISRQFSMHGDTKNEHFLFAISVGKGILQDNIKRFLKMSVRVILAQDVVKFRTHVYKVLQFRTL